MRRTWPFALLGLIECSPSPAQLPPDGGQLPPFDASATAIDAGPLPVTVTVFAGGAPEPGVLVAFQDATGAVLGSSKTDAKGTVSRVVTAGSQVSVMLGTPGSGSLALYTYVGVEPGDALSVVDPGSYGSATATLTALPPSPPPAASYFEAYVGSCGTSVAQLPATLYLSQGCVGLDGKFPLLVLASGTAPSSLAYAFAKDNELVGLDAGTTTLSLSGKWSTQVGTWTIDAVNVPSSASSVNAAFGEIANDISHAQLSTPASVPDAGAASSFETHPGYADSVQSEVNVTFPTGNFTDTEIAAIATRTAPPALDGQATIDLAQLLPAITGASVDFASDPPRPTISWKTAGSLVSADGTFVSFHWVQGQDGSVPATITWQLVVPASATNVHVPALPPEANAWTPSGAQLGGPPTVVTVDGLSGYARLRNLAAALPPPNLLANAQGPYVPPLRKDGTVRLTLYGPSPQ